MLRKNTRLLILLCVIFLSACKQEKKSILFSRDFPNKKDRIEIVEENIHPATTIKDAEFELFSESGFINNKCVEEDEEWLRNYRFAVKIDTTVLAAWLSNFYPCEKEIPAIMMMTSWSKNMVYIRKDNWRINSKPSYYKNSDNTEFILLYKQEGILFKHKIH